MHALPPAKLLTVWEQGRSQTPPARGLTLLGAAQPDADASALEHTTIGHRDAALLALRQATFGSRLTALATCPTCDEQVEAAFECAAVTREACESGAGDFRVPTCGDLLAIAGETDVDAARLALLRRCVPEFDSLAPTQVEAAVHAIAAADPQADVELQLTCPACSCEWAADFDIAAFLWSEIHARAVRSLAEVDALARAYGWTEAEILALSPARRGAYLELVEA